MFYRHNKKETELDGLFVGADKEHLMVTFADVEGGET